MEENLGIKIAARKYVDESLSEPTRGVTKQIVSGYSTWKIQDADSRTDNLLVPEEMLVKVSTDPCSVSSVDIANYLAKTNGPSSNYYLIPTYNINLLPILKYSGNCNGGVTWKYNSPGGNGTFDGNTFALPNNAILTITVQSNDDSTVKSIKSCYKGSPSISGPNSVPSLKTGQYVLYVINSLGYPITNCIWSVTNGKDYASIDSNGILTTLALVDENVNITIQAEVPYYAEATKNITITGLKRITVTYQDNLGSSNTGTLGSVVDHPVRFIGDIPMNIGHLETESMRLPSEFYIGADPTDKIYLKIVTEYPAVITSSDFDTETLTGNEIILKSKQTAQNLTNVSFTVSNR